MNGGTVLKTPAARIDLAGCYAYIGERNPAAAQRFLAAAEATFLALAQTPGMGAHYGTINPRLSGLRCARVRRFPKYVIFFIPTTNGIHVVRVLHAARDIRAILSDEII